MKILARWPMPEALVCIIVGIIAGAIIQDLPTSLLVAGGIVLTITTIGAYLRTRYDPSVHRCLQGQPDSEPQSHNPWPPTLLSFAGLVIGVSAGITAHHWWPSILVGVGAGLVITTITVISDLRRQPTPD